MRLFNCQSCGQMLYFENQVCEQCRRQLGYLPGLATLSALEPEGETFRALADPETPVRFCANAAQDACNWLIPDGSPERFCAACRHNHTIPDLSQPDAKLRWIKIEVAKHRLIYTLLKLNLPLANRVDDPAHGLAFDFLDELPTGPKVMTGHDNGLITIALKEADDAAREKMRTEMGEPYRTLLGHFRHEVGHYYWDVLVRDGNRLDECREIFGDDREDYDAALQLHYQKGPPADWQEHYVSAYATTHPWEDFAETWAHHLHVIDTLETARAFGVGVAPEADRTGELATKITLDPYREPDIETIMAAWLPLTFAMNSLNRGMGLPDIYPFVLSPAVIRKLGFVHRLVCNFGCN